MTLHDLHVVLFEPVADTPLAPLVADAQAAIEPVVNPECEVLGVRCKTLAIAAGVLVAWKVLG
jgi:hypothetical protein